MQKEGQRGRSFFALTRASHPVFALPQSMRRAMRQRALVSWVSVLQAWREGWARRLTVGCSLATACVVTTQTDPGNTDALSRVWRADVLYHSARYNLSLTPCRHHVGAGSRAEHNNQEGRRP